MTMHSHSKRKASTSVPAQSDPPVGKHASTNMFTSHILYSKPIVLDDFHRTDVPPLHDPNGILGDMTRHMSGLSLASMDSPAEEFYRASFTSDRSLYAPDSTRSALISERSSTTALNSDRSSMPLSDFMTDSEIGMVASTPRLPTPTIVPKDERPVQPDEERDFYEKQWMLNFQHSTVQTTVVPDTVYIPPGEQGQLVRISGHSLASGAKDPKQSSSRPYVVFRLEVECLANNKRWTVYRRYHDFKQLAGQLKGQGYRIPSLPSRQLSIRRSFDMAFLRKRQGDLEAWLKVVLSIPAGSSPCNPAMTPAVRMFLIKEANQPPALETGTRGFSYNEPDTTKSSIFAALQMTPPQPTHNRSLTRSGSTASSTTAKSSRHSTLFLHQTEPTKQKRMAGCGRSVDHGFDFLSKSSSYADVGSLSTVTLRTNKQTREVEPYYGSTTAAPPAHKPSTQDFEPLRFIGQGSFGRVLLVRKKHHNELFAMKILSKQSVVQKEQVEHTRTERNVLGSIDHPFIVRLHYAFQSATQLYFILDYCPGGDLFFHLSRFGCFPEPVAKFYAAEISLALVHLHENGVVYRDLKPENIMLDVDGHVKLADFGLAKQGISNRLDGTNTMCGTPEYLPPEILNKKGHGNAVDWWNLGMVLYELLTGRPPWYTTERDELYRRLRSSPLEFPPGMSLESMDLIAGLLERDPAQRLRAAQVLSHPFFAGIEWEALLNREVEPPFRPCQFSDPLDAVNFEDDFTKMPVQLAMEDDGTKADEKAKVQPSKATKTSGGGSTSSTVAGRGNTCRNMSYTFQGFTFDGDLGLEGDLMQTPPSL